MKVSDLFQLNRPGFGRDFLSWKDEYVAIRSIAAKLRRLNGENARLRRAIEILKGGVGFLRGRGGPAPATLVRFTGEHAPDACRCARTTVASAAYRPRLADGLVTAHAQPVQDYLQGPVPD
jgi:hypothetical protein